VQLPTRLDLLACVQFVGGLTSVLLAWLSQPT
jgi:hypothetical protein